MRKPPTNHPRLRPSTADADTSLACPSRPHWLVKRVIGGRAGVGAGGVGWSQARRALGRLPPLRACNVRCLLLALPAPCDLPGPRVVAPPSTATEVCSSGHLHLLLLPAAFGKSSHPPALTTLVQRPPSWIRRLCPPGGALHELSRVTTSTSSPNRPHTRAASILASAVNSRGCASYLPSSPTPLHRRVHHHWPSTSTAFLIAPSLGTGHLAPRPLHSHTGSGSVCVDTSRPVGKLQAGPHQQAPPLRDHPTSMP